MGLLLSPTSRFFLASLKCIDILVRTSPRLLYIFPNFPVLPPTFIWRLWLKKPAVSFIWFSNRFPTLSLLRRIPISLPLFRFPSSLLYGCCNFCNQSISSNSFCFTGSTQPIPPTTQHCLPLPDFPPAQLYPADFPREPLQTFWRA